MKENMRKKSKNTKGQRLLSKSSGITLVALVVTIIVLLILAGVALGAVFSQDGIFTRTEQAKEKHEQGKARETLELALSEAQMQKYEEGLTDEQLDNKIVAIEGELLPKEKPEYPNLQNVIVDGYIFEIDRSVPKIVDYIGGADGVIITAKTTQNVNWPNPTVTLTGKIKTYSGGSITTVSATNEGTKIDNFSIDEEGKYIIDNIAEDTTIIISAQDSNDKEKTITVQIKIIEDKISPIIDRFTAKAESLKILLSATGHDNESGLNHFNYTITSETDQSLEGIPSDKITGTFKQGQTAEINATKAGEYIITITAEDNQNNKSEQQSITLETYGVIKHLKTASGFKEVNTVDVYGLDVLGYTCGRSDAKWQLFYIDEAKDESGNVTTSQVYLISKDCMAPPTTETELESSRSSYYWSDEVLKRFGTTIPNTVFTEKFLRDYKGKLAYNKNEKATNYMLDQTVWQEYRSDKADYAFGGPTLPLFQASYNDICELSKRIGVQNGAYGYKINKGGSNYSTMQTGFGNTSTQKGIYFKDKEKIWLASPSASMSYDLVVTSTLGTIQSSSYRQSGGGFRPIISLKDTVEFIDNGNGTYTIN